jgi:hypothetical protein
LGAATIGNTDNHFNFNSENSQSYSTQPSPNQLATADTGCTGHFLHINNPSSNQVPTNHGIYVQLPNKKKIQATHTCQLNIPGLPATATQAHIFPQLAHALLSIGLLCDHGCTAIFDQQTVKIHHADQIITTGYRDTRTNLWVIPMSNQTLTNQLRPTNNEHRANSAYHISTLPELVQFLHAACGSPVPSTWIRAIEQGHFATWPGLTANLVRKHLPKSIATVKGHLNQQRQNIRSTKTSHAKPSSIINLKPPSDSPNERSHHVYAATSKIPGQISTDLTGRFLSTSSHGNKYILILYDYNSNSILAEPMKNRSDTEHLRAYNKLHQYLVIRGFKPLLQKLDIKVSTALKRSIKEKGIDYQLVPPHIHWRDAAERAIRTFKDHFVACLCTTDKTFPMHLWDRLLPQAISTTLNLLRTSRLNPNLSTKEHLNGVGRT